MRPSTKRWPTNSHPFLLTIAFGFAFLLVLEGRGSLSPLFSFAPRWRRLAARVTLVAE